MDVSPVQSSAKCGSSDFSIERILSNDSVDKSRDQSAASPSWLCCTRYQPPRLPRAVNASRGRRSGRHARVPFTAAQASALEAAYARAPYLAPPALRALAAALQLRDDRIKIWFQNRRARERREKSSTITPPREVTLPPTIYQPQGLSTPVLPWGIPRTVINPSLQDNFECVAQSGDRAQNSSALRYEGNDVPRDLTLAASTSPTNIYFCSNEHDDGERADSPLDIESIGN